MRFAYFTVFVLAIYGASATAGDWPRFRGPGGAGISVDNQATPVTWSPSENLKWKIPLPGPGVSSPIVVGKRVFVTCYSGYGLERANPGEMKDLKRHLVCVHTDTGKILWTKTIDAVLPEDPYSGAGVPSHGYASHTPVSDGERVYVFFGKTGVLGFDLAGNQLWQTKVGTESDPHQWGSSSSPILYGKLVIVTASAESQSIVALDKTTGKVVWRQEAAGLDNVWGTPTLVDVGQDRTDLVLGVPNEIWGINPDTGQLRWYASAIPTDQFNSSIVSDAGTVFAIEGRGGGSIAIRAGGQGDVTDSHVVWTGRDSSRFATPVIYEGRLYYVGNGIASCLDTKTGDRLFQARLEGGSTANADEGSARGGFSRGRGFGGGDYSSPVIADGKLYYVNSSGDTFVLKASDQFEQLAVNRVTHDTESFAATPAISDGRVYLRSNKHLYCVGQD